MTEYLELSLFLTTSLRLSRSKEVAALLGEPLLYHLMAAPEKIQRCRGVVGWGKRQQSTIACKKAMKIGKPFLHLEDGFISYLGHPALGDKRFSLIVDKSGIYYDATKSSDIEDLLNNPGWMTPELEQRSANLLKTICKNKISKYNHEPVGWAEERSPTNQDSYENGNSVGLPFGQPNLRDAQNRVLVVDQTFGVCSVQYGMAEASSFKAMLNAALSENPDSEVWVKVHPDVVLGTKKGYLGSDLPKHPRLHILIEKVNAQSLFPYVDKVYVVTSQLGFEALWHGKEVVCFGLPFYAGWQLTDDRVPCSRRQQTHSIESLFAAACLKYSRYIDPETGERCELEDAIELIALQRQYQQQDVNTLYAVGFSLWKRAFMADFIGWNAGKVCFVPSVEKAAEKARQGDGILVWGAKHPEFIPPSEVVLWRCEDAFIRSNGLGAELRRPASLVLDKQGMYFDCTKPSDLEEAINSIELTAAQKQTGSELKQLLIEQRVSKYNLAGTAPTDFHGCRSWQSAYFDYGSSG